MRSVVGRFQVEVRIPIVNPTKSYNGDWRHFFHKSSMPASMPEVRTCPHCQKWISLPVGQPESAVGVCPHCGGRGTLAEFASCWPPALVVESEPAQGGAIPATEPVADGTPADTDTAVTADLWEHLRSSPPVTEPTAPLIQDNPGGNTVSVRQRRGATGGGIAELVKIVLGGIVGLAIGYWLLLWITGNDFLEASRFVPGWALPVSAERSP
jgi:hypothetical protein